MNIIINKVLREISLQCGFSLLHIDGYLNVNFYSLDNSHGQQTVELLKQRFTEIYIMRYLHILY